MSVREQINNYIISQAEPKSSDMQTLHMLMLQILPKGKLWFDDGKNSDGKTINNATIGYGNYTIKYANGTNREFFQIGMSANNTGISIFIMGIEDKTYLAQAFVKEIGKASVTGYCIRFKQLKDININTLEAAIRYGIGVTSEN